MQIFVLAADGTVLHVLPGFWHPEDLVRELRFAQLVARLWQDPGRTQEQKEKMFRLLHIAELRRQPAETYARSAWQPFDQWAEYAKLGDDPARDTVMWDEAENSDTDSAAPAAGPTRTPQPPLKPLNVLVHQRMVEQPFRSYDEFDVHALVDYGRYHYDLNQGDDGRRLPGQAKLQRERQRAAERASRPRR